MPQIQLACQNCGTRTDTDLNLEEIRQLRERGNLVRYCRQCAGNTRWNARGPLPAGGPTAGGDEAPERRGRILVIDDDENILAFLSKVLAKDQFEIETAGTGREAVQLLSRGDFDLILSDIRMPELDGRQLFAFLDQNLPEYKQKVIFMTGDADNPQTMDFLHQSNCPYLTKPLDVPVLMQLLYQYFSTPE